MDMWQSSRNDFQIGKAFLKTCTMRHETDAPEYSHLSLLRFLDQIKHINVPP